MRVGAIRSIAWLLVLAQLVPAVSAAPSAPPKLELSQEDLSEVRKACEREGVFIERAPVEIEGKQQLLDCRALYEALGLTIPKEVYATVGEDGNLVACTPTDNSDLVPKPGIDDAIFGTLKEEEEREACKQKAMENNSSMVTDLSCMLARDVLRWGGVATGANFVGGASTSAAAGYTALKAAVPKAAAGGAAVAMSPLGEGFLGVAEWFANKVKPGQECLKSNKSSCLSALIAGVVKNLVWNVKAIWELIKLPFKGLGALWDWATGAEDAMADKMHDASQASPEETKSFFSDPMGWINKKVAQLWEGIKHEITHNFGCEEWSGNATFGQMGATGTCVKPWVCFEAASADQVAAVACGVIGFVGGEILTGYLGGAVIKTTGAGASKAAEYIRKTRLAPAFDATARKAGKVWDRVSYRALRTADLPILHLAIKLTLSPLSLPGIRHYLKAVEKAWVKGGEHAGHLLGLKAVVTTPAAAAKVMAQTRPAQAAPVAVPEIVVDPATKLITVNNSTGAIDVALTAQAQKLVKQYDEDLARYLYYVQDGRKVKGRYTEGLNASRQAEFVAGLKKIEADLAAVGANVGQVLKLRGSKIVDDAVAAMAKSKNGRVPLVTGYAATDKMLAKIQKRREKLISQMKSMDTSNPRGVNHAAREEAVLLEEAADKALGSTGGYLRYENEVYRLRAEKLIAAKASSDKLVEAYANILRVNNTPFRVSQTGWFRKRPVLERLDNLGRPIGKPFDMRQAFAGCPSR